MQVNLFETAKEYIINFFKSRLFVLSAVMIALSAILIQQVFMLQIVNGEEYLNNYRLKIEKKRELKSTRGNIYDRNGNLLAYNELAYTITIEDNGSYGDTEEKNASVNQELEQILLNLDVNGDTIDNNFEITRKDNGSFEFNVEGKAKQRFLADVYGHPSVDDLGFNNKLGYDEGEATPDQVVEYLQSSRKFGIAGKYEGDMAYRITVIRYAMSENSYQRYISTTIATDVSDETVAYVSENADKLQGVEVEDDTIRRYVDSKYFAHIIGYTGKISQEEYDELSKGNDAYSLTDVIGKSGIERYLDGELQGIKGSETVYVDNMGKVIETTERTEPQAGGNAYLSIDAELTKAVYDLLEQEIAGIVYDKIINVKDYDPASERKASDIKIPIDDVYFALINNNVIDTERFSAKDASAAEQGVYGAFQSKQSAVLSAIQTELTDMPTPFGSLDDETEDYISYIVGMLKDQEILVSDRIDTDDSLYRQWAEGNISLMEYLNYAIAQNWIDITRFSVEEKYSDSDEIYRALLDYIIEELAGDKDFSKYVYKYMIQQELVGGTSLCVILYDQGVLEYDESQVFALTSGEISAYNFIREKVQNLEITPAQLALDPCSGSCVITDVKTGEILAMVSYPGYDNNRLANVVDAEYFAKINSDLSNPQYNYATQERTAPGSTFKPLMAVAGLSEGVVDTSTIIRDEGRFTRLEENGPTCWAYPSNHGNINVSQAIEYSCNYYFYEMGYRLSLNGFTYDEDKGLAVIQKYADMFGLNDSTGIEIPETSPRVADEYPITASIGQSNNNYTTSQLARYVTAVANRGTVYQETLLKQVEDSEGNVVKTYEPTVKNTVDVLDTMQWNSIHEGMRMVAEGLSCFKDFRVPVAGKTGTAQQVTNRANHALFVGFAPYENPRISIATRIAFGYTSHNAADVSRDILSYYFKVEDRDELINGQASVIDESANSFED
ncbi:MAG: penicillin-binding transpeptidase domain-containing protein [Roseburia sp.]|nr:penicillin-binding transpeptidase domain-containing protein [Roseburia sp.]